MLPNVEMDVISGRLSYQFWQGWMTSKPYLMITSSRFCPCVGQPSLSQLKVGKACILIINHNIIKPELVAHFCNPATWKTGVSIYPSPRGVPPTTLSISEYLWARSYSLQAEYKNHYTVEPRLSELTSTWRRSG